MKYKYICLFIAILWAFFILLGIARGAVIIGNWYSAGGYLLSESFDGSSACGDGSHSNCDVSWPGLSGTTINFDDTGLEGTYGCLIDSTSGYAYIKTSFTGQGSNTIYGFFMMNASTWTGASLVRMVELQNSSDTILFRISKMSTEKIRIQHGTITDDTVGALSASTLYYVWFDFTPGSGSNGTANVYISTTTTKGSALASITTGDGTGEVVKIVFNSYVDQMDVTYDKIRLDNENIGDNPS